MWLRDYHFDGLRLDALHAIVDTSAEPFIGQLAEEVRNWKPNWGGTWRSSPRMIAMTRASFGRGAAAASRCTPIGTTTFIMPCTPR